MFDRLEQTEARYEELTQVLASPDITNDSAKYQKTAKAHSDLVPIVEKFREYKELKKGIERSNALLAEEPDPEMRTYAQDELTQLETRIAAVEQELKIMLLPKDPNDEKNVILEIRAGTGGDEATLFVAEIFRMYSRFAELQGWKGDVMSSSESSAGGLKEVIAMGEGKGVYSRLKYESGVHRGQAGPDTEQQALAQERRSQVKTGDRSEKIRTYNFPQNRVTDHRIGFTLHQLESVMEGKIDSLVEALVAHYEAEKLKAEMTATV